MSKIRIKNFGPIKEGFKEVLPDGTINEWMDIRKVTMFIGNQGSGKSTVARLISTFMWMEKALNRGDLVYTNGNDVITTVAWQRLKNYFKEASEIEYRGERYSISYIPAQQFWPEVKEIGGAKKYVVPKIMYIPAERNFTSAVKEAFDLSELSGPIKEFSKELRLAHYALPDGKINIPFLNVDFWFDSRSEASYIVGKDYTLDISESASGYQSAVPLYILARHLANKIKFEDDPTKVKLSANQSIKRDTEVSQIMMNSGIDSTKKIELVNELYSKYHNKCFINIVEEPEQNLFPSSQRSMLYSLLEFNNMNEGNKLIVTTHSPYLINDLTLAIESNALLQNIKDADKEERLNEMVYKIVPKDSTVNGADVAIYEMDETNGTISLLGNYKGLPSDENKLNDELGMGNEQFSKLLEIENLCR